MTSGSNSTNDRRKEVPKAQASGGSGGEPSLEHFFLVVMYRKWLILAVFVLITAATVITTYRLPDVYTAETLILVDPQQVPENFVQSTVTGDIANRLGSLSQQIMSSTRLQRIIETFDLYAERRQTAPREDVINGMRSDITVGVERGRGRGSLQAFRISYQGRDPRVVAQVTNELASLFIEENLKARERMATGTNDFLESQLEETRQALEGQENKLKDFKLQHLGEMPEHQPANIQILAQLQARLQGLTDSLNRAEQQKLFLQTTLETRRNAALAEAKRREEERAAASQAGEAIPGVPSASPNGSAPAGPTAEEVRDKAQLASLLARYGEMHPDVQAFKRQMEERRLLREQLKEEIAAANSAKEETAAANAAKDPEQESSEAPAVSAASEAPGQLEEGQSASSPPTEFPEIKTQLDAVEAELARNKEEQERILGVISQAQAKIEAVPLREQEMTDLVRDYEISKQHYQQLLSKKLTAETGTEMEIRQKGERFTILDPAQLPERPSGPNRLRFNLLGGGFGLLVGLGLAFLPEFLGSSITLAEQVTAYSGVPVLGVIPTIRTRLDRQRRRRWIIAGAASGVATILLGCSLLLYYFREQIF